MLAGFLWVCTGQIEKSRLIFHHFRAFLWLTFPPFFRGSGLARHLAQDSETPDTVQICDKGQELFTVLPRVQAFEATAKKTPLLPAAEVRRQ